ncbi:MAG: deoxyuridine 5'-triphosphate nucleotidohydrolase [Oscillospiraceae bacterium]|nr:deoxyuridine 5'-triphosphate nucleotidohydrolase [Oscillospiraceae bacterium]
MAERCARFEKVSDSIFKEKLDELGLRAQISVPLPKRATSGSAGYDLYMPFDADIRAGESITVPTGIRAKISDGWFLMIAPRSGLGTKFRFQLDNTVGIIDSDYYYSSNEGHIIIKLTNCSTEEKTVSLKAGTAFAQGIFIPYGITEDDCADGQRTGGFGSTG